MNCSSIALLSNFFSLNNFMTIQRFDSSLPDWVFFTRLLKIARKSSIWRVHTAHLLGSKIIHSALRPRPRINSAILIVFHFLAWNFNYLYLLTSRLDVGPISSGTKLGIMNSMIDGSLQRVDDDWPRPRDFLFYLLRDSTVNNAHNHGEVGNIANVTQSFLGFLQSDVLLLTGLASSQHGSDTSVFGGLDNVTAAWDGDYDRPYYAQSSNLVDSRTMNVSSSYSENDYDSVGTTDSNNDVSENHSSPYLLPWPQRTSWIAIFTLMLFVAIVGNTLVAWIVLGLFHFFVFTTAFSDRSPLKITFSFLLFFFFLRVSNISPSQNEDSHQLFPGELFRYYQI